MAIIGVWKIFTALFRSAWANMKMFVCDPGTTGQQRKDAKALARSFDNVFKPIVLGVVEV